MFFRVKYSHYAIIFLFIGFIHQWIERPFFLQWNSCMVRQHFEYSYDMFVIHLRECLTKWTFMSYLSLFGQRAGKLLPQWTGHWVRDRLWSVAEHHGTAHLCCFLPGSKLYTPSYHEQATIMEGKKDQV